MSGKSRNIFIIGPSHVGKTPIAEAVSTALSMRRISASEWVRRQFTPDPTSNTALTDITALSCRLLREDPDVCVKFIIDQYNVVAKGGFIIEGIRNPRDFSILFRPERDLLIFVDYPANDVMPTSFEREGIRVIQEFAKWMTNNFILDRRRVNELFLASLRTSEHTPTLKIDPKTETLFAADVDHAIALIVAWTQTLYSEA